MNIANDVYVTVIMPIYNAENYFQSTFTNVHNQTLENIEFILVNDNSSDNSQTLIQNYANLDERIRVINNSENLGAGACRNKALETARGEYVIFLDDDDYVSEHLLSTLYKEAKLRNTDILVYGSNFVNYQTKKIIETPWTIRHDLLPQKQVFSADDISKDFFRTFIWWPWDKFFKKEFIKKTGILFQEIRTSNDLLFTSAQMMLAERISIIKDVMIHHTVSRNDSLENTREKSAHCALEALTEVNNFLSSNDLYEKRKHDFMNYAVFFIEWNVNTLSGEAFYEFYNDAKFFLKKLKGDDTVFYEDVTKEAFERIVLFDADSYLFNLKNRLLHEVQNLKDKVSVQQGFIDSNDEFLSESKKSKDNLSCELAKLKMFFNEVSGHLSSLNKELFITSNEFISSNYKGNLCNEIDICAPTNHLLNEQTMTLEESHYLNRKLYDSCVREIEFLKKEALLNKNLIESFNKANG